jgi:ribosomal-protein-alanine N-acetyltransferase
LQTDDAASVAALHALCFKQSWKLEDFLRVADSETHLGFTAWNCGRLTGFILARYAAEEGEILTFCVAPDRRRQGIASQLLQRVFEALRRLGTEALFIEVGAGNDAARRLYEGHGFQIAGQRRDYYRLSGGREDAIIMRRDLIQGT